MIVRSLGGLTLLLLLLSTACGGGTGLLARGRVAPVAVASNHLRWGECGDGFQCTSLEVPLDYSRPRGRQISLALIRKPATGMGHHVGSVLMNPGGPGGSGIDFLRSAASDFVNLNTFFDLVSWDPRGVGMSAPVSCYDGPHLDTYFALDSVLDDAQEKAAFVQAVKDFTAACAANSGDLLPFMDSESTARDMDRIREAVGDSKLTYLGFSYGTYIGQWYAHLFPKRVRALALDGVVDSTEPGDQFAISQVAGFQKNLDAFFAACRSEPSCTYGRSGDPAAKLPALIASIDASPVKVGSRELTRSLALRAILASLYDESFWPYLDEALAALEKGDARLMLEFADSYDGRYPNGTYANIGNGANQATACLDSAAPVDIAAYDQMGPALAKASPLFGPFTQYGGLECAFWPVKPKHADVHLTIKGTAPILLVGATNDPATPYANAQSVTRQIPGSVLLTREGNGHTSYGASQCIQNAEDSYLISLDLPPTGEVCRA
ncbi:MAG TPA: alpha/beta hydrolase [Candidatus Dormibacteraeota bacterium]|nr:alpha/beta hydrolase [Candidatus Dormibacteraeota bacterium]